MKYIKIIIAISIFVSCSHPKDDKNAEQAININEVILTDAQYKNAGIETSNLQNKSISTVLKVNGIIEVPPQNMISISVPMGGYLRHTRLLPGMQVSKGEVIATIDDQQYIQLQQDYLTIKSKVHYATLEYNRQKELNQSQASSDKITQQSESELNNNQILLESLKKKLQLIGINPNKISSSKISNSIFIYSPINGYVSKINVNIGKYVSPSDIIFELINPSDYYLNIKVFEKDVNSLSVGQKVTAYTNSNLNQKYNCTIVSINKDISVDGTIGVFCRFDLYDKTLLSGMYMNAEMQVSQSFAKSIPEEAIVNFEGKDYVYLQISKNKFQMQEVQVGQSQNEFSEIINADIIQNKTIVTKGAYALLMKMKNTEE